MLPSYPLHILEANEVQMLFKNSFVFHKQAVKTFVSGKNKISPVFKEEKTLHILTRISILCSIYHIDTEEAFKFIKNATTLKEIQDYFYTLKQELSKKKITEKKLIEKGLLNRLLYGTKLPPLFQNKSRIYVKIDKIPSLAFLVHELTNRLNLYIPHQNLIQLQPKEDYLSYFIIEDNKKIKIGRFLTSLVKQIEGLKMGIKTFQKEDFQEFKLLFNQNTFDLKEMNKKLNSFFKKKKLSKISLHIPLFFELKKHLFLQQEELIDYLHSLKELYFNFLEQIHYIQIRTNKNKTSLQEEAYANMIILSVNPRDISRVSEYTSWKSCMGQEDEYNYDLPMQIGAGSIVAYLVNSNNPYKRLGRILLKPFVNKSGYQYTNDLLNFFNLPKNKKKLTDFDRLITFSYSQVQDTNIWLNLITDLKKELSSFKKRPNDIETIYLPDQQYGIMHQQFLIYIKQFLSAYINPQKMTGIFKTPVSFYRDKLQWEYYFPDPQNKDNLKEYLILKNIPFQSISKNEKTYIHTNSLCVSHLKELNLSGVIAHHAKVDALSLENLDERGIEAVNLEIMDAEKITAIPQNVYIKKSLTLQSSHMITLPSNIKVQKLTVEAKNLKIIPSDIQVSELTLIHSKVQKLPPLSLDLLDIKHSKITDVRPINVRQYLDLSYTPVQYLNENLNVEGLFLRHCEQLKKLPKNLKVKWLDIGQTNIEEIPPLPYECLLMVNAKKIERLPHHISFNTLEAQGSGLKSLPDNLSAEKINLSKTNFQNIPKNLHITQLLLLNETPIQSLPSDLIAKEVYANKTKISQIAPDTQIKTIHLIDTPLEVVHFSKTIQSIYLNKVPQFIHPKFSVFRFIGISEEDVKLAQQRYQMKYLEPVQIIHQTKLNLNSSIDQFRTLE
ncbi:MAG: hypothetical protein IJY92_06125 [Alphaproteobacteria bacterium]|nr:hypothetical protein [Alphaproteobacteria bacterium]